MESVVITPELRHQIESDEVPILRVQGGHVVGGKHISFLGKVKGKEIYRVNDMIFTVVNTK